MSDDYSAVRSEVAKLCGEFPGEYWRAKDRDRAYPGEFVETLTRADYLAAAQRNDGATAVTARISLRRNA